MWKRLTAHPVRLILALALLVFALYEVGSRFVAYTGDAYDTSDIVVLSAELAGPISEIFVEDNHAVAVGDRLFAIDPAPYRLALDESRAALNQAEAERQVAEVQGEAGIATLAVATANVEAARAAVARAEHGLGRTTVAAPAAGHIAPFPLRRGDYLQPGTEVMAIVTGERRRIIANISERHLARLRIGQAAWITLGSQPWRVHSGRVSSIAVAVARSSETGSVIPYVSPTTDWVRLPRRFPVEITLDAGPDEPPHHPGADARVLIWF